MPHRFRNRRPARTIREMVPHLAASFTLARLMASFLYDVKPTDSFTYAVVSVVVLAVSAIAAWLPARRAASIDPTTALHYE